MLNCQHRPLIWLFLNMTFLHRFWFCSIRSLICVFVCTIAHRHHLKIKSGFIDYTARVFRPVFCWCCKCSWCHISNKRINHRAVAHKMHCMDTCISRKIAIYATDITNIEPWQHFTCMNCSLTPHSAAQRLTLNTIHVCHISGRIRRLYGYFVKFLCVCALQLSVVNTS